jgi:hypothetical protein
VSLDHTFFSLRSISRILLVDLFPVFVCALLAISVYQLLPNHGCSTSLSKSIQASHVEAIKKYLLQQTHGRCASPHLGARPPVPTEMGK